MLAEEDCINRFRRLIDEASNIVVLTGAGISTDSGIPDFRSPGGMWEKFRIIQYSEFMVSKEARLEDWRRRFYMEDQMGEVKPNVGHKVLANWVKYGKFSTIITQNVDGLHHESGVPSDKLIEIHGNARQAICANCELVHSISDCRQMLEETKKAPSCFSCKGTVKSAVVMFGQPMPLKETELAFEVAATADLFIAIGTSLVVHPAASLPIEAKRSGAKFAILNRDPTEMDSYADCVVNGGISEVLSAL